MVYVKKLYRQFKKQRRNKTERNRKKIKEQNTKYSISFEIEEGKIRAKIITCGSCDLTVMTGEKKR